MEAYVALHQADELQTIINEIKVAVTVRNDNNSEHVLIEQTEENYEFKTNQLIPLTAIL